MPVDCLVEKKGDAAIRLIAAREDSLEDVTAALPKAMAAWVRASGYTAKPGTVLLLPDRGDAPIGGALVGMEGDHDLWSWGGAAASLPNGRYCLDAGLSERNATRAALGWALGSYRFARYKSGGRAAPELVWPDAADRAAATPRSRLMWALIPSRRCWSTMGDQRGAASNATLHEFVSGAPSR